MLDLLLLALVFEDSHHPGNIVNMFYQEGGIKLVVDEVCEDSRYFSGVFPLSNIQCGDETIGLQI